MQKLHDVLERLLIIHHRELILPMFLMSSYYIIITSYQNYQNIAVYHQLPALIEVERQVDNQTIT